MTFRSNKPEDVKRLMQDQVKVKAVTKQVDSPYAKYNSRGQLMCVVCGIAVKSAIVWQAHVNKRSHLESLEKLKLKQQQLNSGQVRRGAPTPAQKRPASPPPHTSKKKDAQAPPEKPKGILKKFTSYSSSDSEDEAPKPAPPPDLKVKVKEEEEEKKTDKNGLPEGFFDEDKPAKPMEEESMYRTAEAAPKEPPKPNTSEVLPEGFFDDPVADAKARKVEYKDKDAEEWVSFMREVSAAEQVSRTIIEEDKEEAALVTQIQQADEQIAFLNKVVELDHRKNTQLKERGATKRNSDDDLSSDEEFVPVTWRTKNSQI